MSPQCVLYKFKNITVTHIARLTLNNLKMDRIGWLLHVLICEMANVEIMRFLQGIVWILKGHTIFQSNNAFGTFNIGQFQNYASVLVQSSIFKQRLFKD